MVTTLEVRAPSLVLVQKGECSALSALLASNEITLRVLSLVCSSGYFSFSLAVGVIFVLTFPGCCFIIKGFFFFLRKIAHLQEFC